MEMVKLDYRAQQPLYKQIKDGLARMIVTGALAPDDKIPSVRDLAASLAINPNTIQRAYRELEREGYIYSVVGRGSFVSETVTVDSETRKALFERFDEASSELFYRGFSLEDLIARLNELSEDFDSAGGLTKNGTDPNNGGGPAPGEDDKSKRVGFVRGDGRGSLS